MIHTNDLISELKRRGKEIGQDAAKGMKSAEDVIRYYSMWHRCPGDPGAQAFTEEALFRWAQEKKLEEQSE